MGKPKLIHVLRTLKSKEWNSLKKYLLMYLEPSSNPMKLFMWFYEHRNKPELLRNIDEIRVQYFPSMKRKLFLNLFSRLHKIVEIWISNHQLQQDPFHSEIFLVKFYNRRGLYSLANQATKKIQKTIQSTPDWNLKKSSVAAELLHQQYYSDNPVKYHEGGPILQDLVHSFMHETKNKGLLYLCEMHNWGQLRGHDYSDLISSLSSAIAFFPGGETTQVLNDLRAVLENNDTSALAKLSQNLLNGKFQEGSELHVIVTMYTINLSLKFWHNGTLKDFDLITQLINYGLQTKILLVDGQIPLGRFCYICSVLSSINTYEWSSVFIDAWIRKVKTKDVHSTRLIMHAQNCLYHDREEDILRFTRAVQFENTSMRLRVGLFNLASLYKTRKEDLIILHSSIKNYKVSLRRYKKLTDKVYYNGLVNFVKVLELLLKREYKNVEIELSDYSPLQFKIWLQKQIK